MMTTTRIADYYYYDINHVFVCVCVVSALYSNNTRLDWISPLYFYKIHSQNFVFCIFIQISFFVFFPSFPLDLLHLFCEVRV